MATHGIQLSDIQEDAAKLVAQAHGLSVEAFLQQAVARAIALHDEEVMGPVQVIRAKGHHYERAFGPFLIDEIVTVDSAERRGGAHIRKVEPPLPLTRQNLRRLQEHDGAVTINVLLRR